MQFRTFYDRIEKKVPTYKEVNFGSDDVKPNLTLSVREIYERWRRNEPLDLMTRNGTFMSNADEDSDENFDRIDIDNLTPEEMPEYDEYLRSRLDSMAASPRQPAANQGEKRSDIAVETPQAAGEADGEASLSASNP